MSLEYSASSFYPVFPVVIPTLPSFIFSVERKGEAEEEGERTSHLRQIMRKNRPYVSVLKTCFHGTSDITRVVASNKF